MDEIPETITDDQFDSLKRGLASITQVLNQMPAHLDRFAKTTEKFARQTHRRTIERVNGIAMDEDSLLARRTGMATRAIKAKKATGLGESVRSREPRFMCPEHKERLVFSRLDQVWACPSPGCNRRKLPSMDRTDTTIIKSAPRVVGRMDEDNDVHWYLNFMDENIMIELPFSAVSSTMMVANNGDPATVSLTYTTTDAIVFGKNGNQIEFGKLSEPEPDTI